MKPFTYERAHSPAEAAATAARIPGAKFIAGGTNLLDLMKLQIETPTHLIDVNGLALDTIETTPEGGLAHRRAGAQHRSGRRCARAARLWPCCRGRSWRAPRASFATRQPLRAICFNARAARISTIPTAVQQTPARQRLRGDRWVQPPPCRGGRERGLHRHAPERHGGGHARARRDRGDGAPRRHDTKHPDCRVLPPARRHAAHRDRAGARAN